MRNIPRLDRTQGQAVLIRAFPLGGSWFEAQCSGQLIVARTREPLLDGARALLAAGYHPDTVIVLRHAGSELTRSGRGSERRRGSMSRKAATARSFVPSGRPRRVR